MTTPTLSQAFNEHLAKELYSAYSYLAMAAYFEDANYPGFAKWMHAQAGEEFQHAMKFWTFIYDTGGKVTLLAIDQPRSDYSSPLDAFSQALKSEQEVTAAINDLYAGAVEGKDYAAQAFLQWFVTEQVEEEKTASQIVETLEMAGDSATAILLLDRELGSRDTAEA